jgi:hypothetical protein
MSLQDPKHIYIVTHGEKWPGPNPAMTEPGRNKVGALRRLLPETPSLVVIGTGARHLDVACALNLLWVEGVPHEIVPTRFPLMITSSVGGPESLEADKVVLANGTRVPHEMLTTPKDGKASMIDLVKTLPDNAVICAGRPALIMLGKSDCKNAAVYRVVVSTDQPVAILRIEEVL